MSDSQPTIKMGGPNPNLYQPTKPKSYGFVWFLVGLLLGAALIWYFKDKMQAAAAKLLPSVFGAKTAEVKPSPPLAATKPDKIPMASEADKTAATIEEAQADDNPDITPVVKLYKSPAPATKRSKITPKDSIN